MTTTDAAKLREAAQRLFSADSDYWFAIDHKPIASADAQLLARHILATVPEELPVPQPLQPGDKVLVEAEYLFSNIRNEHTLQMRQGICCYDVLKGFCITVPLSSIRPFPQEEASQ